MDDDAHRIAYIRRMTDRSAPRWLTPLTEYGPLAAFFLTFWKTDDLILATKVVVITTLIAVAVSYAVRRKIPWVPLITAAVVTVFGGLTIWLKDETFIKMKPTIIQGLFAVILLGAQMLGKYPLRMIMGQSIMMPDRAWRILTYRFAGFFAVMAIVNEAVWRTQSTEFWVSFKVFGILGLTFVFVAAQIPYMMRHGTEKSSQ